MTPEYYQDAVGRRYRDKRGHPCFLQGVVEGDPDKWYWVMYDMETFLPTWFPASLPIERYGFEREA